MRILRTTFAVVAACAALALAPAVFLAAPTPAAAQASPQVDLTGTIAAGGVAQQLVVAGAGYLNLVIYNNDPSEDLWVAFFGATAAPNGAGSIKIPAGGLVSFTGDAPRTAVSIYGATTGHKFTAWAG